MNMAPAPPFNVSDVGLFHRLLDALPAAAYMCDRDGLVTYYNRRAAEIWGRAPRLNDPGDRFCGSFKLFTLDGDSISRDACWMARALAEKREYTGQEVVIERPDGTRVTVLAHISPVCNSTGEVCGAVNVLVDVSERRQATEDRALLAAIVDSSEDAIVSKTLEGIILSWNAGAQRLFGYSAEEVVGGSITRIIPPDRLSEETNILARLRRGERIESFETVRVRKDGTFVDVSLTISPVRDANGRIIGASKIARDVSRRKRAERALADSEQRFARFMRHLPGLAWIKDLDGRYVFVNDGAERAFGRPIEQICGRTDGELFDPQTAAKFRENDARALASGGGIEAIETLNHADGLHHSIVSKFPIPGADGRPAMVGGMAIDITERVKIEDALRESESRFRHMADHVPALIWVTKQDSCDYVNREYLRFLGRPLEAVQGDDWVQFVHPSDRGAYVEGFREAVAAGTPFHAEFRFRRADGEYRWMRSSGVPRFTADGSLIGYVGCSIDIEDAKRSSENLYAVKNALADQLADLRRLHDMSVRLSKSLELQPILEETLRTAAAIEGTEMGLLSLCDAQRTRLEIRASIGFDETFLAAANNVEPEGGACRACFVARGRTVIEDVEADPEFAAYREIARQAGFRAVHSTPLTTRSGDVVGVLSTHFRRPHRPTDREMHLIDLCARQAVDFIENARLYDELREADRRKDEFLATLAHELRNPLAPISNAFQFFRLDGDLSPTSMRVLAIVEQQVQHLVRLVDDLLEVSRITRGKIDLRRETTDLASLILAAVETSRPQIEAAGHQLALTLPPEPIAIEADPVRMTQVLANLLNNAAKFTEPGGQIWLTARRENGEALVSVRDSGIGIAAENLPRIFETFAQVDRSLNRSQGGLGLGLTLARSLTQMHGGRLTAASAGPGLGSEFTVRLPTVRPPARLRADDAETDQQPLPVKNVLVVDDSESAQYVLSKLLDKLGQHVRATNQAAEGIAMALEDRPDIIFSDVAMPLMDGYEFARRIRLCPELDGVLLVALTGYGQDSDREMARRAGFDHHLTKPVSAASLRELLRRLATPSADARNFGNGAFSS